MQKQFVTYDIAVSLKEKGFKEKCIAWYYNPKGNDPDLFLVEYNQAEDNNSVFLDPEDKKMKGVGNWKDICEERKYSCSAPLWQQVIEWIWDKYSLNITIKNGYGWEYAISDSTDVICGDGTFNTRNEATKEAILKVFELIKNQTK